MSAALDAPFDRLLVHPCAIGGDFGGKGDFMDVALCYVLSQRSGGPVKMIMDSGEEFVAGNPRHAGVIRVKTGVTRDGLLMSQHMDFVFDSGAYGAFKPMGLLLGAQKAVGPYRIPTRCRKSGWSTPTRFPAAICVRRAIPRACSRARARWTWWRGNWAWTRWSSGEST